MRTQKYFKTLQLNWTMKKIILLLIFLLIPNFASAKYIYYYWETCPHCANVWEYFLDNDIEDKFEIEKKEVYFNENNRDDFLALWKSLWIKLEKLWVPFLYDDEKNTHLVWDKPIINLFEAKLSSETQNNTWSTNSWSEPSWWEKDEATGFWKFFLILLPAALADSINPCAFTILFIILSTILSKTWSKRKALLSWIMFSLSIFISYYLMWVWLYKALSFSNQIFYLKLWAWIIAILIWLANIKDYFWYWKVFLMEIPMSWRPKLWKILKKITSPGWAFFTWFLVSLFLLPCTSWPYLTVLSYLSSESSSINLLGYIYLLIYNIIFILPFILITFVVYFGIKDVAELKELKEYHNQEIHLVVWILMLLLWGYLMVDLFLM